MFISWVHFLFLLTLTMVAARVITLKMIDRYPGTPVAEALAFIYG